MKRKLISLCLLPLLAFAQWAMDFDEDFAVADGAATVIVYEPESNFTYTVAANKATITGYSGPGGQLNIPPTLGGYPVTSFGVNSLWRNTTLTGLLLPNTLESVGMQAFVDCSNLRGNLVIPYGVTALSYRCFAACGFDGTLSLPETLVSIDAAFGGNRFVGQLVLPSGLTVLSAGSFSRTKFTGDLNIPVGITTLGMETFRANNFDGTITTPDTMTAIGMYCFMECKQVKNFIMGSNIQSIATWAFRQTGDNGADVYFRGLTAPTLGSEVFSYRSFKKAYRRAEATGFPDVPNAYEGIPVTAIWTNYPDLMP